METGLAENTSAALWETHPEPCQVDAAGSTRGDTNPQEGTGRDCCLPGTAGSPPPLRHGAPAGVGENSGESRRCGQSPSGEGKAVQPKVWRGSPGPRCPPRSSATRAAPDSLPPSLPPGSPSGKGVSAAAATPAHASGAAPGLLPPPLLPLDGRAAPTSPAQSPRGEEGARLPRPCPAGCPAGRRGRDPSPAGRCR